MTFRRARPCPICGKPTALTKDGHIRWHRDTRPKPGGGPVNPACAGSSRLPDDYQTGKAMPETDQASDHAALVDKIRRLLADSEDARKTLNRAEAAFRKISDELLEMRMATDPTEWRTAYAEAQR